MTEKSDKAIEKKWTKVASNQFLGKKIVAVRYMTREEADDTGWHQRPVVLVLDDGSLFYPSSDDEGNGAGSLFTNNEKNPIIPVLP